MRWDGAPNLGGGIIDPREVACHSCNMRSYKVGGVVRCIDWKRHRVIVRCLKYRGPKADKHKFDLLGEMTNGKRTMDFKGNF